MRQDETLTRYEGYSLLTMVFLYHLFNEILPRLVKDAGTSAWIARILSACFAFGVLALFLWLAKLFPDMDLLEICDKVYGRVIARIMLVLVLAYLLVYAGACLNQSVELMQLYAYSDISALEIDVLIMGAVACFGLYSIKGMGKTVSIFLPFIYLCVIFILLLSYHQYDPALLAPALGHGISNTLWCGFKLTSEYSSILILSIFWKAFGDRRAFRKAATPAILSAAGLNIFSTICYNMAVPYNVSLELMAGIIGIAQSSRNSRFVQRLESVFIAVSVVAIILLIGIAFLAAIKTWCHMFSVSQPLRRAVILPMALLVLCIARTMGSRLQVETGVRVLIRQFGVFFVVGFLLLTLLVALLRRGGRRLRMRWTAAALVAICVAGMFSGCAHAEEADAVVYPVILGYDKGENAKYRITMRLMSDTDPKAEQAPSPGSEEGEKSLPADTFVVETSTYNEGIDLINAITPKRVSLLHVKMIVMSEELAREDGLEGFIPAITHYNEIRPTIAFVVTNGSAYDFVSSGISSLSHSLQLEMELILSKDKQTTSYYVVTLGDLMGDIRSPYGDAVAMYGGMRQSGYPGEGKDVESEVERLGQTPGGEDTGYAPGELPVVGQNQVELAGMTVFQDGKLIGSLSTKECQTLMFLSGIFEKGIYTVSDPHNPDYRISIQLRGLRRYHVDSRIDADGKAFLAVSIILSGRVGIAQNPDVDYSSNSQERTLLSSHLSATLEQECRGLLNKLQHEYRADPIQLGRYAAKHFATINEWEQFNWREKFPEAEISVSVQFNI